MTLSDRARFNAVLDVRSPSEFAEDHLPGAENFPVLDDAQRAEIGTLHKQVSPFAAKRRGAAYVSANIARYLETAWQDQPKDWRPLVVCWRGGQRSGSLVTVLRSVGWEAGQLEGGYKAFRTQVLADMQTLPAAFQYRVLMGRTGSAKTRILQAIAEQGGQVLDLETLARHKGSVLGAWPGQPQPSQKAFETALWQSFQGFDPARPVYLEAESPKIGALRVPDTLLTAMHQSPCIAIEVSVSARVDFLLMDYAYAQTEPTTLCRQLDVLRPLRGHEVVNQWQDWIKAGAFAALTESLLVTHYDPLYTASLGRHFGENPQVTTLVSERLEAEDIMALAQQALSQG